MPKRKALNVYVLYCNIIKCAKFNRKMGFLRDYLVNPAFMCV